MSKKIVPNDGLKYIIIKTLTFLHLNILCVNNILFSEFEKLKCLENNH